MEDNLITATRTYPKVMGFSGLLGGGCIVPFKGLIVPPNKGSVRKIGRSPDAVPRRLNFNWLKKGK
jgi:hypothetical protein